MKKVKLTDDEKKELSTINSSEPIDYAKRQVWANKVRARLGIPMNEPLVY